VFRDGADHTRQIVPFTEFDSTNPVDLDLWTFLAVGCHLDCRMVTPHFGPGSGRAWGAASTDERAEVELQSADAAVNICKREGFPWA
jgi:hypothetical protein